MNKINAAYNLRSYLGFKGKEILINSFVQSKFNYKLKLQNMLPKNLKSLEPQIWNSSLQEIKCETSIDKFPE